MEPTQVGRSSALCCSVLQLLSYSQLALVVLTRPLQVLRITPPSALGRDIRHKAVVFKQIQTDLHAPGGVPQTCVRPHLDGSVVQLLRQLQHLRVVGYGLVELPLRMVGTAQVAVRSGLLTPVLQSLPKTSRANTAH